jgi:ElaA protein
VTLDERTAKIGRVAVAKPCREKGIGKQLMLAALEQLKRDAFAAAVLTAQVQVIGFYEKLGFVAEGPVFDEAGIPHRKMTRVL